ncbi:hypothetical protein [Streptomyces misionensis]|uniref:hypothetical protein n=1 Tax=Streptomyces misionensis TaxID=67331 RepID=UPI00368833FF
MACRTGCPTPGKHKTWGECARSANLKVAYCGIGGGDATEQKRWDAELDLYRAARRQGIQPDGTTKDKVMAAIESSNAAGAAYGRDFGAAPPAPEGVEAA